MTSPQGPLTTLARFSAKNVPSLPNLEEYTQCVRLVLQRLLENKLYVKVEKCEFHVSSEFLNVVVVSLLENVPTKQRYRRIPASQFEIVKAHIKQLLEAQIIWESCSPYAAPLVLVQKKDGSLRMCVD